MTGGGSSPKQIKIICGWPSDFFFCDFGVWIHEDVYLALFNFFSFRVNHVRGKSTNFPSGIYKNRSFYLSGGGSLEGDGLATVFDLRLWFHKSLRRVEWSWPTESCQLDWNRLLGKRNGPSRVSIPQGPVNGERVEIWADFPLAFTPFGTNSHDFWPCPSVISPQLQSRFGAILFTDWSISSRFIDF